MRIVLKKAYADGTLAVDMDPLSLLCRLATSVPPPRFHTVRYAGVLAAASPWRSRIAPKPPPEATAATGEPQTPRPRGGYRPWAELLARTFAVDVLACPKCQGRMKLIAMVKDPTSIACYLAAGARRPRCRAAQRTAARRTGRAVSFAGWPQAMKTEVTAAGRPGAVSGGTPGAAAVCARSA